MEPVIEFNKDSLIKIEKPDDYFLADPTDDEQIKIQQERESTILSKIYYHDENIPKNPLMDNMKKFDASSKMFVKGSSLKQTYRTFKDKELEEQQQQNLFADGLSLLNQHTLNSLSTTLNQMTEKNMTVSKNLSSSSSNSLGAEGKKKSLEAAKDKAKENSIELSEDSLQQISYLNGLSQNYRTFPCKNYHGSQGCGRSIYCHFIHLIEYEGTLINITTNIVLVF